MRSRKEQLSFSGPNNSNSFTISARKSHWDGLFSFLKQKSASKALKTGNFAYFLAEVESRTQSSRPRPRTQKNPRPRPRTAFPRTDPLEAKDRNARGQGQEPRTQPQVFSKKKRSSKKFFRRSPFYRRSQNFRLRSLNHKSHAKT